MDRMVGGYDLMCLISNRGSPLWWRREIFLPYKGISVNQLVGRFIDILAFSCGSIKHG